MSEFRYNYWQLVDWEGGASQPDTTINAYSLLSSRKKTTSKPGVGRLVYIQIGEDV